MNVRTAKVNDILIKPTKTSPGVSLDFSSGKLTVEGRSLLTNALKFYHPLITSLETCNIPTNCEIDFKVDYYNTSSTKCIFLIFKKIRALFFQGHYIKVNWYTHEEDEDHLEFDNDLENMLGLTFNYVYTN